MMAAVNVGRNVAIAKRGESWKRHPGLGASKVRLELELELESPLAETR